MMSSRTTIETMDFGLAQNGEAVKLYTLKQENGIIAKITNYGATLCELHVPDNNGKYLDLVLGFSNLAGYVSDLNYIGSTVGRVSGRIPNGIITMGDKSYQLTQNEGNAHLHGGRFGFDKQVWSAKIIDHQYGQALQLHYFSPHGEEGYPGNLDIFVTYSLGSDTALNIDFRATSDSITPLSLTNHSYFNLNGEGNGSILNHEVQILSDLVVDVDDEMLPTGFKQRATIEVNDFKKFSLLNDRIQKLHKSHGDNYFVNKDGDSLRKVGAVKVLETDRLMEIHTNASNLQLYTGSALYTTIKGKSGSTYQNFSGICFECQGYANFSEDLSSSNILVSPNQEYKQIIKYKFLGYGQRKE